MTAQDHTPRNVWRERVVLKTINLRICRRSSNLFDGCHESPETLIFGKTYELTGIREAFPKATSNCEVRIYNVSPSKATESTARCDSILVESRVHTLIYQCRQKEKSWVENNRYASWYVRHHYLYIEEEVSFFNIEIL